MLNKNFLNIPQQNIENDPIISQLEKADYFIEISSFRYSFHHGAPDTYYLISDFNIKKQSGSFLDPWKIVFNVYSLNTFDICYSPYMRIYNHDLIIGSKYFGVCYINNILIYTESASSTYETFTIGIGDISGKTYTSPSYRESATILSEYFDNDIHSTYPENTDINIPLFIAFYKDAVPNEIINIANNDDELSSPSGSKPVTP